MEDFNYLLHREQTELLLAANASSFAARSVHMELALGYAVRISSHRIPYRTPRPSGGVAFNPGKFGAASRPTAKLFRSIAK